MILPAIAVRLIGKPLIVVIGGNLEKEVSLKKDALEKILLPFLNTIFWLSNRLILYSPNLLRTWKMERFESKILIAHEHFPDPNAFEITKPLEKRSNIIGHIGCLREDKGSFNFVRSIPHILKNNPEMKFLIGGDGSLKESMERFVKESGIQTSVRFTGWIPHDQLPGYLNDLKLIVLPSNTEGLPNLMLEAMACGTPVLATGVGAIPDAIKEGETGFILPDNSPESISERIIDVISSPCLSTVSERALELVHERFSYEKAVQGWRDVLENVSRKY
jgi:glycosyltransferase involved in cell wall biosynthesis